jgi:DNA-binding transcriptional LysR family regulator
MPISTVSRRIAELEDELGVRLLNRSTRNLRLTELGAEVLEQAIRSAELSEAVDNIVSNRLSKVSGTLRLSAPPTISDTLLTPIVTAFQAAYPDVRIQIFVTDRHIDHIAEGIDLAFRLGALRDSSLVARKVLAYRRQLVASPGYLQRCRPPEAPKDLLVLRVIQRIHNVVRTCDIGPWFGGISHGTTGMCGFERRGSRAVDGHRGRPQPAAQARRAGAHRACLGRSAIDPAGGAKRRRQPTDRVALATTLCRERG